MEISNCVDDIGGIQQKQRVDFPLSHLLLHLLDLAAIPLRLQAVMLAVAAFSLLGLFRLSRFAANLPVAWATTALAALYPVFFTQSSLAHLDLAAAGLTFWGLLAYLECRPWKLAVWLSLALRPR